MSDEDKDSKTEEASERKLQQAREKGDSYNSREPGHAMAYLALLVLATLVLPAYAPDAALDLSLILDRAGQINIENPFELQQALGLMVDAIVGLMLPVLMVMLALAMVSALLAGPFFVSLKRIEPKFSKMNPISGIKRLFSVGNLVEFIKNLVKLALIAGIFLWVITGMMEQLLPGAIVLPEGIVMLIADTAFKGLSWVVALMIPIMIFDVAWKRSQWLKKQRMSKKDQKDEHKDIEGDPYIKMRRQEIGRARARKKIAKAVPDATLIITNPTHYAIALRYERGRDMAPVCLAKGQDLLALKIREIALENDVPVLESPPLARALYKVVEVDDVIPEEHWAAVAELVGYVLDLRRKVRRKLPEGTHHLQ